MALCLVGALGCRQFLSIDEARPLLGEDGGAGLDATASEDAGAAPSYCKGLDPQPEFCADFDEGPVIGGWDNAGASPDPFVTGGGALIRDDINFRSAPHAASLGVPALLAPSTASVALVKAFSAPPGNLVVDFDVRIDTEDFRDPRQTVMLLSLTFPRGQIAIARGRSGLSLATFDERLSQEALSGEPLAVGSWRRLSLLLTGAEVTLQVDGVLAAKLARPPNVGGKGTTYLGLGVVGAAGNMGPFRATLDNVSFTSDAPLRR